MKHKDARDRLRNQKGTLINNKDIEKSRRMEIDESGFHRLQ